MHNFTDLHTPIDKTPTIQADTIAARKALEQQLQSLICEAKDCRRYEHFYNVANIVTDFPVLILSAVLAALNVGSGDLSVLDTLGIVLFIAMAAQKWADFATIRERFNSVAREVEHLHAENLKFLFMNETPRDVCIEVCERTHHTLSAIKLVMPPPPILLSRCCK